MIANKSKFPKENKPEKVTKENKPERALKGELFTKYDAMAVEGETLNELAEENEKKLGLLCERVCTRTFAWLLVGWLILVLISMISLVISLRQPVSY